MILQETNDTERALESYKKSYELSNSRVALNRVCDLLYAGYGMNETTDSKKKWFELQKVASSAGLVNFLESTPRRDQGHGISSPSHLGTPSPAVTVGRDPRIFQNEAGTNLHLGRSEVLKKNEEYTNPLNLTAKSHYAHPSPDKMDVQMKYLEQRRLDEVLSRIVEQNTRLISAVALMSDEIKDLRHQVSTIQSPAASPYPAQNMNVTTPPNGEILNSAAAPTPSTVLAPAAPVKIQASTKDKPPAAATFSFSKMVQVKKVNNDEKVIYKVRAKIFNWAPETHEWKERGLGSIRILQDRTNETKSRIVMWREQTLKLACNHWITSDMTFKFHQNNKKALFWSAVDFSEDKPKNEVFVCRFGKEEQCAEFLEHVQKLVELAEPIEPTVEEVNGKSGAKSTTAPAINQVPLSELFKKPEGSWTCSGCNMNSAKEALTCPS